MRTSRRFRLTVWFHAILLVCGFCPSAFAAEPAPTCPSPEETARKVDEHIVRGLARNAHMPEIADDETFLRRIFLDLTGKVPESEILRRFLANAATDKRAKIVDDLLKSDAYSINWGRYWRDTVTYHTPASANYLRWQLIDAWWKEEFKRNRPWNEIVTSLLTSSGVNDEIAPVNYLTALYGNPVEMAATTSRVFLGVQIQCAECHNAKFEPWKREQFHELAAFFGRAKIIQHKDVDGRGTPYAIESRTDGQYRMTDKDDPNHLIAMQPRFLTGESVRIDANDEERRQALARLVTSPKNPWFAKCYVNRIWTAMMGWGFYPTVTDLGAEIEPVHKPVLELLEKNFVASGFDVKWLFRTIALTRAYQRSQQVRPSSGEAAAAVCPVYLRPEQVFEALQRALGFDENDKKIPAPATNSAPAVQRHTGLRNMVYQSFKQDPSMPAREIQGTIPETLLMMNSALIQAATSAEGKTLLGDLLAQGKTDEQIVGALYERVFSRKPTAQERDTCLRYLAKVGNRKEALEDVLWALVNSTEFLLKK
ncbi:MAG TPA: DUF1549 domain-containing protein [Gemmataceae bacterium]|nr:DUF1549 domain-containing protein [Gemmataceae bacterium]